MLRPRKIILIFYLFFITSFLTESFSAETKFDYIVVNDSIIHPLNSLKGDPVNGRKLVINRNKGNCLACHSLPIPEEEFHGSIGPSLQGVAKRLNRAQIRLRVSDMKQINPYSIMPGYYRSDKKMNRVAPQFEGTTLLSTQEIEDIVVYLSTLN